MARESRARLRTPSPQNEKRPFKCSSSVIMCPSLTSHPLLPNACYLSKVRSTGLSCAKGLLENIYLISATTIDFRQFLPPTGIRTCCQIFPGPSILNQKIFLRVSSISALEFTHQSILSSEKTYSRFHVRLKSRIAMLQYSFKL
jgi:hypothetical protein